MPRLPPKRPLTAPPTRTGVVDAPSTGISSLPRLAPPRPSARSFPALTASSRKQPVDPTVCPFDSFSSIVVFHSEFQQTTSPSLTLLCALRKRQPMKRSRTQSKRLPTDLSREFWLTLRTRSSPLTSLATRHHLLSM